MVAGWGRGGEVLGQRQHDGGAAFHIVGAATVEPVAVAAQCEGRVHPLNANGVHVGVEQNRRGLASASYDGHHVGPTGGCLLHLRLHACRL